MKTLIALLLMLSCTMSTQASEPALEPLKVDTGMAAVERGVGTLMETCNGCHSLKYIRYRDLVALGIAKEKVDKWRGEQPLDEPMVSQMSAESAMQSFAKVPPDLSMMAKAREGGASYVYSYLIGYYNTPDGMTSNHVFPETKMPDPFGISYINDEKEREEIRAKARDVVSFLYWASDPHEEERHRLGYYVIGYLLVLTMLTFFVKRQTWARLD
jgi:cytochrome c1